MGMPTGCSSLTFTLDAAAAMLCVAGRLLPVADYREKLLAVDHSRPAAEKEGQTAHVLVPAASLVSGALAEDTELKETNMLDGEELYVPRKHQVGGCEHHPSWQPRQGWQTQH